MKRSLISLEPLEPRIAPASLAIGNATVNEGTGGTKTISFDVTLTGDITEDVTVDFGTEDGTATIADHDYVAKTGTLTFNPGGAATQHIDISIGTDNIFEGSTPETFLVKLSNEVGATVDQGQGTGSITDDDAKPTLSIGDAKVLEGDAGDHHQLTFTLKLSNPSNQPITIDLSTEDGTGNNAALKDVDYIAKMGSVTFDPGQTSKTFTVDLTEGDSTVEPNKDFKLNFSAQAGSEVTLPDSTSAKGTILDDDATTVLTVKDVKIVEGTGSNKTAKFLVEIANPLNEDVTFHVKTRNGTAVGGSDYASVDKDVTIKAGSTSTEVDVTIGSDSVFEGTESFFLKISNPSDNVSIDRAEARGTIYNDDIQQVDLKTIRYVDVDGDLVTVKITKGVLTKSMLGFEADGDVGGQKLTFIDFTGNPALFNGTSLSVTAAPQPGFVESGGVSDGKVNVGYIQAGIIDTSILSFTKGIDFKNVVIEGDLGGMTAGDLFVDPAIRGKMVVDSVGAKGTDNMPSGVTENFCYFLSAVHAFETKGDFVGTLQSFGGAYGDIHSLKIGGELRGDSSTAPGKISFTGRLSNAVIGKIVGGSVDNSGRVIGVEGTNATIGTIRVLDGIVGGDGKSSGAISATKIGKVIVGSESQGGNVTGGKGETSGQIYGKQSIGAVQIFGSVTGGEGLTSGSIFTNGKLKSVGVTTNLMGGSGESSGLVYGGAGIGTVTIGSSESNSETGNVAGGSGKTSGTIRSDAGITNAKIFGNIIGGNADAAGGIQCSGGIGSLSILGSMTAEGGDSSKGAFVTADRIARMTVGSLQGTATARVTIAAAGTGADHLAIGSLTVLNDMASADVLGGYAPKVENNAVVVKAVNADALINKVVVNGKVKETNIVAGVTAGDDTRFGTGDDALASGSGVVNNSAILSTINEVIFNGGIDSTEGAYGISAQYVKKVTVSGTPVALVPGPGQPNGSGGIQKEIQPIAGSSTFQVVELGNV